jgi:hypothetical protein
MARLAPDRERAFPLLLQEGYDVKSANSLIYNCIAFAADRDDRWWWPDPYGVCFWPPGIAREENLNAFVEVFKTQGYELCSDGNAEEGYEKIVIYEKDGKPTHAPKQTPDGKWKSKLGSWEDIEHNSTEAVETWAGVGNYGKAKLYMRRPLIDHLPGS